MIISHKHRFIFIKTGKTAGTSIEIALSKFCGPEDVITPVSQEDEKIRRELGYRGPQNYKESISDLLKNDRKALAACLVKTKRPQKFFNHITASRVRAAVGEETWNSYFTFTAIREPYDRAISLYYWRTNQPFSRHNFYRFSDYIRSDASLIYSNWERFTEDNKIIVDDVIRFENLRAELTRISELIGFPEDILNVLSGIKAKSGYRPKNALTTDELKEDDIKFLYYLCKLEIETFGYRTPD